MRGVARRYLLTIDSSRVIYVRRVGVDVIVVVVAAVMLLFVHRRVVHDDVIRRSKILDDENDIVIEGTLYRRIKAILFAEDNREGSAAIPPTPIESDMNRG